jgi:hypothetical protein
MSYMPQSLRRKQQVRHAASQLVSVPDVVAWVDTWDDGLRTAALLGWQPVTWVVPRRYWTELDKVIPKGAVIDRRTFFLTPGGRYVMLAEQRNGITIIAVSRPTTEGIDNDAN